ncbi:CsbD family protein [Caldimonas brevitalea]|uniref:General stress protein CsbD n=1 Tax=Caldimonas brevitalea TaxID=413882 RepID=A0A0G3BZ69_9BURK|nr:CsbD family protein [Caldimonas brevitalea]AKJ31785.1 general stress protein CsbD [Caldimonas brevitalea]
MNRDQLKGRMEQAKGKTKEMAGRATDDLSLEAKGRVQKNVGDMRGDYGDAKERAKDHLDRRH